MTLLYRLKYEDVLMRNNYHAACHLYSKVLISDSSIEPNAI